MLGERLKFARDKRKLTLKAVADLTQIGQSSLSEFENDTRQPKLLQLQALSKLYGRSESFFLSESPLPTEQVLWRERPEENIAARIESTFLRLCEQYHNLEQWCGEHAPSSLPPAPPTKAGITYQWAEKLAHDVRQQLALGDRPALSLASVLEESCGIKVFYMPLQPTGTAACSRSDTFGMAILINTLNARRRRNFDLGHELFHLITWQAFRGTGENTAPAHEEQLANVFASALLMPTDALKAALEEARQATGKLHRTDLIDIARQFDVSIEALLWRMKAVFPNRNEEQTKADIEACKALGKGIDDQSSEPPPPSRPERFRYLVLKALQKGEISTGRAAEFLGITRRQAMMLEENNGVQDAEVATCPA